MTDGKAMGEHVALCAAVYAAEEAIRGSIEAFKEAADKAGDPARTTAAMAAAFMLAGVGDGLKAFRGVLSSIDRLDDDERSR